MYYTYKFKVFYVSLKSEIFLKVKAILLIRKLASSNIFRDVFLASNEVLSDKQARNGWMVALVVDDGRGPSAKNSGGFSGCVTMKMHVNFVELRCTISSDIIYSIDGIDVATENIIYSKMLQPENITYE